MIVIILVIAAFLSGFIVIRKRSSFAENIECPVLDLNVFNFQYREISVSDLKLQTKLGNGSSGSVYKGKWRNVTVAIKCIPIDTEESVQSIRSELQIMASLGNHPNIILLIGACTTLSEQIFLVLKFCDRGSLYEYLIVQKAILSKDNLSTILRSSASALEFLHSKNIVHRDIAARNFLLASPFIVYLSDFGLSRLLQTSDSSQKTQSSIGPIRWMAPESIFQGTYSSRSDSYMYAMFLYEVLFRCVPFSETSNVLDVSELVAAGERPPILDPNLDSAYMEVFEKCWSSDPSERLSMSDISKRFNDLFVVVRDAVPSPASFDSVVVQYG